MLLTYHRRMAFYFLRKTLLVISCMFSLAAVAQKKSNYSKLMEEANAAYGTSDILYVGQMYAPEHKYAKGYPFFLNNSFLATSVYMRNNIFTDVKAQYDIETDKLILGHPENLGEIVRIVTQLNSIDSFLLAGHLFVNIAFYDTSGKIKGYYELIRGHKKNFFVKYRKKFVDSYNDLNPAGFYTKEEISIYKFDGNIFLQMSSKKIFLEQFGEHKKQVRKYMRTNSIRFRKLTPGKIQSLMQYSNAL